MTFRTSLCEVLGIEYPIVQSGMGGVAGPELAAEVSNAGALGVLAGVMQPPEQIRADIRRIRTLTDRPFGVNLWLYAGLRPPPAAETVSDATMAAVQRPLDTFRARLGLPPASTRPAPPPDILDASVQVVLEERVPVLSTIFGPPDRAMAAECHRRGMKVIAMVATVDDARAVASAGCDAVIAQGAEAGGHRSTMEKTAAPEADAVGTIALVPQVAEAVDVPVIAAGGIADGRGLVAALALGAAGALLGTRFVATRESAAAEVWKKAILERDGRGTTLTDAFTGLWARTMRTAFTEEHRASGAPVLPALWQALAARDLYVAAVKANDGDYFPMYSGQSAGIIHDLPGAREVVQEIVREARAVMTSLDARVQTR
jgi:nitronate monooxygenase